MSGKLYLVGAGPGDPGLLTLRGRACLARADVVIYDYLANPRLLDHAPATAERILVGKHGGGERVEQDVINQLILDHARAGKTVVRLKGGDPLIFGRGAEEAEAAVAAAIDFEIVPGVSAAVAVPAYAGIPLTHRELASNVIFTTGYEQPGKDEPAVRWHELARAGSTLVLLMTTRQLAANLEKLIAGGLDPSTPAALIEWGTRADQRTLVGTVASLGALAREHDAKPPAIAVVGAVVGLRQRLQWFERKPLFGRRLVLTRPREQNGEFAAALEDRGAEVLIAPAIEIVAAPDPALDTALRDGERYDWLIFTSANGVRIFFDRMVEIGADIRTFHRAKIAAIGPQTARALSARGLKIDIVPDDYRAEGVVEALAGQDLIGRHVLLPRAAGARDLLPIELRRAGAVVDEIHTYNAKPVFEDRLGLIELATANEIDLITFTSSSTVSSFALAVEGKLALKGLPVGCIGPITAETAVSYGMNVLVKPEKYTVPAFVDAIVAHFATDRR